MMMKLQICTRKKVDFNVTFLAIISLDSALQKDENYYLQVFLKECKQMKKKVIRHIKDDFSDDSEEKWIKVIRLMFFDRAILRMYF